MQGKILFVLGAAAGYVVGTRVGRQGYENLKRQANDVLHDPKVQKTVANAGEFARDKIPVVGDIVGDLAQKASGQTDAAAPQHAANATPGTPDETAGDSNESAGEKNV